MSEVLIPITQFNSAREQADLALRIKSLVNDPEVRSLLQMRHLTGVLDRYPQTRSRKKKKEKREKKDVAVSVRRVADAREQHRKGNVGSYAVLASSGDVIGMASVIPGLRLRRHRTPLPKPLSRGVLREQIAVAGPEITAWTHEAMPRDELEMKDSRLSKAYRALLAPGGPVEEFAAIHDIASPNAWTIEPTRVPDGIHRAILLSGLRPRGHEGRYDDAEPERLAYPVSVLYCARPLGHLAVTQA